jgi:hypothetical protein
MYCTEYREYTNSDHNRTSEWVGQLWVSREEDSLESRTSEINRQTFFRNFKSQLTNSRKQRFKQPTRYKITQSKEIRTMMMMSIAISTLAFSAATMAFAPSHNTNRPPHQGGSCDPFTRTPTHYILLLVHQGTWGRLFFADNASTIAIHCASDNYSLT